MGLDLTLAVDTFSLSNRSLAYERLTVDRDYELFDAIDKIETEEVKEIWWYEDEGVTIRSEDPYGAPLRKAKVKDVANAFSGVRCSPKNSAVRAYLLALPPDTEIIFWWH
jgi:hypothetical protein